MEPREMWERHAVLARAYFGNDEDVRRAQGDLDERNADRMRTLAAFAVTLGSDGTVAELLGLHEREVRLARRTVGKDDARAIAKALLDHHAADAHKPPVEDVDGCPSYPEPEERHVSHEPPAAPPVPPHAPVTDEPVHVTASSTAVDAVLVGAWSTGTDLAVLASELGLDLPRLVARTRYLEAQGRLTHASPSLDRSGRHRRVDGTEAPAMPQPRQWYYPSQPRPPHQEAVWDQQSSSSTFGSAPMHDWDGILDQWQVSTAPTASWQGFA
ncbi:MULTISPECIES: hypothetical protein [Streptomyces]|uniref:hypothetical protein n=1 Tax=unclassified Streptomyces TaxID=2593676 RepID=UPI00115F920D|nr:MULTISPECIES: hypothetical protein [unclassified Streptomyces]MDX2727795.1 hypothetical protein [Streptomyces sp. PA03-2a]MDX3764258.1 hypothetical protein [Streptomyces sp. AK08-01B]MDX3814059.1 hypothetical protein [Streptomyces sp. AK08-01A]